MGTYAALVSLAIGLFVTTNLDDLFILLGFEPSDPVAAAKAQAAMTHAPGVLELSTHKGRYA